LEIIHTDICGPFNVKSVDGFDLFITFTDDCSRFGYIYPMKERAEALDKFKLFKAEVENQHDRKIKIVRSDRGGEYYRRHMPYGQIPGPFAKFLQKNGIKAQYSAPGEPQQMEWPNDVIALLWIWYEVCWVTLLYPLIYGWRLLKQLVMF